MDQLMQKLMMSKAIMDRHDNMKRGQVNETQPNLVQDFSVPQARYNIPQEFLQEQNNQSQPYLSEIPKENTKPVGVPSVDAIKNSKLPDEIKKLMMEHPIAQQQQPQMTISNELVEKASRLMKKTDNNYIPESAQKTTTKIKTEVGIDYGKIQEMINVAVRNALKENGMIVESAEKTNEMFSFRVGKHLFEGKISKVKKFS